MDDSITPADYYNNKYIFITTDCIGDDVALKHATFTEKIIPNHPEITVAHIKEGIEYAEHVRRDAKKDRFCYYKPIKTLIMGKHHPKNIKVVAEIIPNSDDLREIVTSYVIGPQDIGKELTRGDIIYDKESTSTS